MKARRTLIVFLGIGLVALAVGMVLLVRTTLFVSTAQRTMGKVVDLESRSFTQTRTGRRFGHARTETRRVSHAVFQFKDRNGAEHRVTEPFGSNPPLFQRGADVTVLYERANPENARIRTFRTLWLVPSVFGAVGAVFTSVAFLILKSAAPKSGMI